MQHACDVRVPLDFKREVYVNRQSGWMLKSICAMALTAMANLAAALPVYTHDNGVAGPGNIGYGQGADLILGNYFVTQAGRNAIDGIEVYWGRDPGVSVTLAVIDDPNGDHNLADGVVLSTLAVTPGAADIGHFVMYGIAPVTVSGGFFVAALVEAGPGGPNPIFADTSSGNNALGYSRAVQASHGAYTLLGLAEPGALALTTLALSALALVRRRV
jgi:hypothetical protein